MDRQPLKDEENVMKREIFLQGSSERPLNVDQSSAADVGNDAGFNPEIKFSLPPAYSGYSFEPALSLGVRCQNSGTHVFPKESAEKTLLSPEDAVRTLAQYESITLLSNSTSAMSSDHSLHCCDSNMRSSKKPVPFFAGTGISSQKWSTLNGSTENGTHGVSDSNDSHVEEISLAYAENFRNEDNQPSFSTNASVLESADPGSGLQTVASLNAPEESRACDDLAPNDFYGTGILEYSAPLSRNAYKLTISERNFNPDDTSSLAIAGSPPSPRKYVLRCSGNSGLNETFREGTCRSFLSPYDDEYAMPGSDSPPVKSSVLESPDQGTCPQANDGFYVPEHDEPCVISQSNDLFGFDTSHYNAVPSKHEYKMTMSEPKSILVKSSVPRTLPQKCLTLFAPNKDVVPDANDDIGEAIAQFLGGHGRNVHNLNVSEPISPPDVPSVPEIAGPGSCPVTYTNLEAGELDDGTRGVPTSMAYFLEGPSLAYAAPSRNGYDIFLLEQASTSAKNPDLESAGSKHIPPVGTTLNAPEQEIILPDSYETFKKGVRQRVCRKCGYDCKKQDIESYTKLCSIL